jgi:hypothetical protein
VIQQPIETTIPRGSQGVCPGAPVWDEEDSLDDLVMDAGLLPWPYGRNLGNDDLSRLVWPQCNFFRSPSHVPPLRC